MAYQAVFKRVELKYMLTLEQKELVLKAIAPYMELDEYGRTTIRNVYFDTDNYLLIRRSIEKPVFKEKIRIRSYSKVNGDEPVFVELKKKYKRVVYKRRMKLTEAEAMNWICNGELEGKSGQIADEISYFISHYQNLKPTVFLSYEREAFYDKAGTDFRVTFDDNILGRTDELSLTAEPRGTSLLDEGKVLMEIKTSGGIPLWMTRFLTEQKIFKTSFSKYGNVYRNIIFPKLQGGIVYA